MEDVVVLMESVRAVDPLDFFAIDAQDEVFLEIGFGTSAFFSAATSLFFGESNADEAFSILLSFEGLEVLLLPATICAADIR
jgi:hypothetical protein